MSLAGKITSNLDFSRIKSGILKKGNKTFGQFIPNVKQDNVKPSIGIVLNRYPTHINYTNCNDFDNYVSVLYTFFEEQKDIDVFLISNHNNNNAKNVILFDNYNKIKQLYNILCIDHYPLENYMKLTEVCNKSRMKMPKFYKLILRDNYFRQITNMIKDNHELEDGIKYDEIWLNETFVNKKEYYEMYYQKPCKIIPFLWNNSGLENIVPNPLSFVNKPTFNISIFELNDDDNFHNSNVIYPLLLCESVNPLINKVFCFNISKYVQNPSFMTILRKMELFKKGKILSVEPISFQNAIQNENNVILSYQKEETDLRHLFMNCFYLGVPLIHNQYSLREYGYYYDNINTIQKIKTHLETIRNTFNREEYIENNKGIIIEHNRRKDSFMDMMKSEFKIKDVKETSQKKNSRTVTKKNVTFKIDDSCMSFFNDNLYF